MSLGLIMSVASKRPLGDASQRLASHVAARVSSLEEQVIHSRPIVDDTSAMMTLETLTRLVKSVADEAAAVERTAFKGGRLSRLKVANEYQLTQHVEHATTEIATVNELLRRHLAGTRGAHRSYVDNTLIPQVQGAEDAFTATLAAIHDKSGAANVRVAFRAAIGRTAKVESGFARHASASERSSDVPVRADAIERSMIRPLQPGQDPKPVWSPTTNGTGRTLRSADASRGARELAGPVWRGVVPLPAAAATRQALESVTKIRTPPVGGHGTESPLRASV